MKDDSSDDSVHDDQQRNDTSRNGLHYVIVTLLETVIYTAAETTLHSHYMVRDCTAYWLRADGQATSSGQICSDDYVQQEHEHVVSSRC